jgi:succinate dehydrogenase/fumarate reductase flavoprotein subunit
MYVFAWNNMIRFCNELGRRDYVTDKILSIDEEFAKTKYWSGKKDMPLVYLVLSSNAAAATMKYVEFYISKGFLKKVENIHALANEMGLPVQTVESSLRKYQNNAMAGIDEFGKKQFLNVPNVDHDSEFYVGKVSPVLHYCMGGLCIDTKGNVLDSDRAKIPGLHACGEVTGGVHGDNRLAGNSLLECVVFGRIVSGTILLK